VTDRDDGYHNDGNPRHYEWWYFDLFTQAGLKAAVILMDRPLIMLDNPDLPPMMMLNVELPDGTNRDFQVPFPGVDFIASEEHCDVKLGNNWCKGHVADRIAVILDHLQIVGTGDQRNFGPAAFGHPYGCRVLRFGGDTKDLRFEPPARGLQGIGPQSMLIKLDAHTSARDRRAAWRKPGYDNSSVRTTGRSPLRQQLITRLIAACPP
ncbi:hypothetical protein, partial [Falsirhodobacter sp. alg1]|uniref:hypothetical protein n=1 Tax=Falsirhodobacter sp. alg1 TaxID=1472418 RepID=UPI00192CFCF1